jgi:hypothetical protein
VSLIQSDFGSPGNLEAIVVTKPLVGDGNGSLVHYFRDANGWHGPFDIVADGKAVSSVAVASRVAVGVAVS